jgi:hypothetical protein
MLKTLSFFLFFFVFSNILFSAETQAAATASQNTPAVHPDTGAANAVNPVRPKKIASGMKVNYFMVGASMFFANHDVVDNLSASEYDVKYFATDLYTDFQYLFKRVMLNITFEFMKYGSDMKVYKTTGSYTSDKNYEKKAITVSFGYSHEFVNKYLLIFPVLGFSYKDYENPTKDNSFRLETYYLVLGSKFFINVSKHFYVGVDFDFRLILSNVATLDHEMYGNCRAIIRKGFVFNFSVHLRINIATHFVLSFVPWFHYSHIPRTEGILINLDDGTKNNEVLSESRYIAAGLKVLFGVYF